MAESDRVGEAKNDSAVMLKRSDVLMMTILGGESSSMAAGRVEEEAAMSKVRKEAAKVVLLRAAEYLHIDVLLVSSPPHSSWSVR